MRGNNKSPGLGSAANEPGIELSLDDFKKTTGKYDPKDIVIICDELGELMNNDNFKAVSSIKEALGSLARLGRAAGFHLVLATQKATSNVINSELMNNIHQSVLLGEFDSAVSTSMFEKDISYKAKPEIPGRGFSKSGKEIVEFQSYWTTPDDFKFVKETLFESTARLKGLDPQNIKASSITEETRNEDNSQGFFSNTRATPANNKFAPPPTARSNHKPGMFKDKEQARPEVSNSARSSVLEKEKESTAPERIVSRAKALNEDGEIDYAAFLD